MTDFRDRPRAQFEAARAERRVAFIGHLIDAADAILWDPSLAALPSSVLDSYIAKPSRLLGPTVLTQANVRSATGEIVHLTFVGLFLTSKQISHAIRTGEYRWIMDKIEDAVAMARDEGCSVVGLGGYTSILSGNCRRIRTSGIALTSGNALTASSGVASLTAAARRGGIELSRASAAVVGGTGNVGAAVAMLLAPAVAEITCIARDVESPRVRAIVERLRDVAPRTTVRVTKDMHAIRGCQAVVAASSASDYLIHAAHVDHGPLVVCDLALPSDVSPDLARMRPDAIVVQGGLVRLPQNADFTVPGVPLLPGYVYACMAETLLLGLENASRHFSYGDVAPEQSKAAYEWATKHGFEMAGASDAPADAVPATSTANTVIS